jgi:enterochelin esterase family protein
MINVQPFRLVLAAGLVTLAADATPRAWAQPRPQQPTPNDTLKSAEVLPDRQVTFRIYAPKADEVTLMGDWVAQGLGSGGPLQKDDKGVWSITVGPLPADFYSYSFTVDGVRTFDPKNPQIKQGVSSVENLVEVPGNEAEFEANHDVPHGEVRSVWYQSGTLAAPRRMHVYTPPGYEGGKESYPVFYLLHGGGDEDSGWSTIGRAGFILDNLIAAKRAVPMLVVMPNGSLPIPKDMPARPAPGETPSPEFRTFMENMQNRFTAELLKEVVPVVEKTYRVKPGPENRALAGLSMGGGQTQRVLTSHPDQFAYVGIWSAGLFGGNAEAWSEQNKDFLSGAEKVNKAVKLLSISVGDKDFALAGSEALSKVLDEHGIKREFHLSGGGHTWINWRHYLRDFASRLFQPST